MVELCPSILSSDFLLLKNNIKILEDSGIKYIHLDIMDGHFVNNITIGPDIVKSICKNTKLMVDVHLMISYPLNFIQRFINNNIFNLTFHYESKNNIDILIKQLINYNCKFSIAINPETDIKFIIPYLKFVNMILIMTVDPGFGNQMMKNDCIKKIYDLKKYILNNNLKCKIQIDGGVNLKNISDIIKSGVDFIVVGSAIFSNNNIEKNIKNFFYKIKD